MEETYKLAIIGNPGSVLMYKALGVETFDAKSHEEALNHLETIALGPIEDIQHAVVFVEQSFYKAFPSEIIERLTKRPLPAVTPVPSPSENDPDFSKNRLKVLVEKAVGSDILA